MTTRPVAVVLDGPPTPAWQERALAGLVASPALDVVEARLAGRPRRGLVRRLHAAVERRLFYIGSDAFAPMPVSRSEIDAPRSGQARALVIWLSERPVPVGEPCDVLHLRHGRLSEPAEDALRRAVMGGAGCLETEVLLARAGGTVVVERTVSEVRPFSITLSCELMLWKLAAVVPRAAERVPGLDLPAPASAAGQQPPYTTTKLIAHVAVAWLRALATRLLFRRPWSVRVRERRPQLTEGWSTDGELVRWRRGHLYADPFLFEHSGRHHLFCEEVPLGARLGVISHTELRPGGGPAEPPAPILEQPYHLSYPFVFTHEGEVFLIPETSAVSRVELYRAHEFPHKWQRVAILLEAVDAVDATIVAHDDLFWLFAGVAAPGASSLDELHLFWAHAPSGPWHPHPRNPVVSDVRCARPAGAIQRCGARLVRPGQDGSRRYGGAVSFREIDVLSTTDYAEHEIARLEPADLGDARATHTYASDGRFEAIDLRRRELRVRLWPTRLANFLRPDAEARAVRAGILP